LFLLGALASGCVQVNGEIQEIRRTIDDPLLSFEGAADLQGARVTEARTVQPEFPSEFSDLLSDARLTEFVIRPQDGTTDLSFVHTIRIGFGASGELAAAVVAEYNADAEQQKPNEIALQINPDVAHTDYLRNNNPLELLVDYDTPVAPWAIVIDVAINASMEFKVKL